MTLRKLASMLAKKEGKKSQVAIGNIRELLSNLIELEIEHIKNAEDGITPLSLLVVEASNRAAKKSKKSK